MEFGMNYVRKMWKWLTKWKLVDTTKYEITEFSNSTYYKFVLTKWQQEQVDKLYEQYGGMDYCFYFSSGLGIGFKVKIWKTNEWIDLTDINQW
jgi:hypothetical protein